MDRKGTGAPRLAELQAQFMRAILKGEDGVLDLIPGNSRTNNETLFAVYRNAYVLRLIGVVASDHEFLLAYLGAHDFNEMAAAYVRAHPSTTPNARWFSQHLPEFLRATAPYSERPELGDLAAIERALNLAFDAKDDAVIGMETLGAIPPETWGDLVFTPRASAVKLKVSTNAHALWSALKAQETPPPVKLLTEPEHVFIWRSDTTPMIRVMGPEEAMLWGEAVNGVSFGALCELLAVFGESDTAPMRAAQYLQTWLAGGLLSGVSNNGVPADAATI